MVCMSGENSTLNRKRQRRAISKVPYWRSLGGIFSVQALREGLEISSAGEQLYPLRRSVALAQLYNAYARTQADPHTFLYLQQNQERSVKSFTASRKRKRVIRQDSFGIRLSGTGTRSLTTTRGAGHCSFFLSRVPQLGRLPARDV